MFEILQTFTLEMERDDDEFQGLLLCTDVGVLNHGTASIENAMSIAERVASVTDESPKRGQVPDLH